MLRIATFNCENLFSRPRLFTGPDGDALVAAAQALEAELKKEAFDHVRIDALKTLLDGVVDVIDVRGKHVTATGAGAWLGWVEFKRSRISDASIRNTARVIADADADVVCLCEVESRPVLCEFHDAVLKPGFLVPGNKQPYPYALLIDGNDARGIDVALLSRLPVTGIATHLFDKPPRSRFPIFSRDCFEATLDAGAGGPLHVLLNHFKSRGYSGASDPAGKKKRTAQAARVAEILARFDLTRERVVVAGDLNDGPASASLAPLLALPNLHNVVDTLPERERGTFGTRREQIDYLLVSTPLRERLTEVRLERRGIWGKPPHVPYDTVVGPSSAASDHAAVVATFDA